MGLEDRGMGSKDKGRERRGGWVKGCRTGSGYERMGSEDKGMGPEDGVVGSEDGGM
jgi:hypothetical protein